MSAQLPEIVPFHSTRASTCPLVRLILAMSVVTYNLFNLLMNVPAITDGTLIFYILNSDNLAIIS